MTTSVTAAQIAEVRRLVGEPLSTTYTDALITTFIERYPLLDIFGEEQYDYTAGNPPTPIANTEWIPTFDLASAAADIWNEKAAVLAGNYDFSADGGNYSRSQAYEMAMKQARYYRSRRSMKTIKQVKYPEEPDSNRESWIGNINNPYE